MENVPPPTGAVWAARGTKRSHNQMSGREPSTSSPPLRSISRSPSVLLSTPADSTASSPSHTQSASGSSSEQSTPLHARRERDINELLQLSRPPPNLVRLPSFRELDAQTVRREMPRLGRDGPDPRDENVLAREEEATRRRLVERGRLDRSRHLERHLERPRIERERERERQHVTIDLTSDTEDMSMPRPREQDDFWDRVSARAFPEAMGGPLLTRHERERASRPFGHARRGPRFPAEIIDLSGDTPRRPPRPPPHAPGRQAAADTTPDDNTSQNVDTALPAQNNPQRDPASSPEVTFIRARAISPRLLNAGATPPATAAPFRLNPPGNIAPIEILDDEDDLVIVQERLVPEAPQNRIDRFLANLNVAARAPDLLRLRMVAEAHARQQRNRRGPGRHGRATARRTSPGLFVPPVMDFGQVAFDLGYPPGMREPEAEREPSPIPTLPPVPEGFTRNPVEEDVLVCPACECELSVGKLEEEVKRQVWMAKKCGHVYCGECAASRLEKSRKKGKEPKDQAPPLKKCAVAGCDAKTTGRQMVQLFL